MKKFLKKLSIGTGIGLAAAGFLWLFMDFVMPEFWSNLENKTYDLRCRVKYQPDDNASAATGQAGVETVSRIEDVVIVNIDERSMLSKNLGVYYKWPRSYQGEVVEYLRSGNNAATVFDIQFNDADFGAKESEKILGILHSGGPDLTGARIEHAIRRGVNYDSHFVESTRRAGNVIHALLLNDTSGYPNRSDYIERTTEKYRLLVNPASSAKWDAALTERLLKKQVLDGAFPALAQAAARVGLVNVFADPDAIHRHIPLVFEFRGHVYPGISLQACLYVMGRHLREAVFVPGRYLDLGRPFHVSRENSVLTVSYPGVNEFMVRGLIRNSEAILALKQGEQRIITEKILVRRDAQGRLTVDIPAGRLAFSAIKDLVGVSPEQFKTLPLNEPAALGDATGIVRTDESLFSVVEIDNGENTLTDIPYATLFNITQLDARRIAALAPGESWAVCENLTAARKEDGLSTEYFFLRGEILNTLLQTKSVDLDGIKEGEKVFFGEPVRIPVDNHCRMRLNFKGLKQKTFKSISFYDIKAHRVPREYFTGKIFLMGSDAPSMFDIVGAPMEAEYPGVETHATAMVNILNSDFMRQPPRRVDLAVLVVLCLAAAVLTFFIKPFLALIAIVFLGLAYFLVAFQYFSEHNLSLQVVQPMLGLFTSFIGVFLYRYITEERDKKFLKATFENYLSPELIDQMYESRQKPALGGEEGIRTAFFTDIQSFSTFSEKLGPTKLVELLNEYLTAMTDTLMADEGTLDKYEGDAIIAFFGAPMPLPDHAERACRVALNMQKKLGELRAKWSSEGEKWPAIVHNMRMRIGVNSGPLVTGNMGSTKRMNYTMMGDTVNLAARLESASKQYGVYAMISQFTRDMVGEGKFEWRELDKIAVMGKTEPVTVFELMAFKGELDPRFVEMARMYQEGLAAYKKQEWDKAIAVFKKTDVLEKERHPDAKTNPSLVYINRCVDFKAAPPGADWDGVYRLTSK